MLGKKVEKAIRYDKNNDTYYVQFTFQDISKIRSFATLEEARKYRDAIYAEKTVHKTMKDLQVIYKAEEKILSSLEPYPINVLKAAGLKIDEINKEFLDEDSFNLLITNNLSEKEFKCLTRFYGDGVVLDSIGTELGICKERVRQIIAVTLKKVYKEVMDFEKVKARLEEKKIIDDYRREIVEEFKRTGVYSDAMLYEFGPVRVFGKGNDKRTIEELKLSQRSYNALKRSKINYLDELCAKTEDDLYSCNNLGVKSIKEITEKLKEKGLELRK